MNYVWAQRETEEHREESETIAVPFLDLKEKEEREREVLKRESVAGKSRVLEEDGRNKKEMGYWGNILTVLMPHTLFSDAVIFASLHQPFGKKKLPFQPGG